MSHIPSHTKPTTSSLLLSYQNFPCIPIFIIATNSKSNTSMSAPTIHMKKQFRRLRRTIASIPSRFSSAKCTLNVPTTLEIRYEHEHQHQVSKTPDSLMPDTGRCQPYIDYSLTTFIAEQTANWERQPKTSWSEHIAEKPPADALPLQKLTNSLSRQVVETLENESSTIVGEGHSRSGSSSPMPSSL